MSNRRRSISRNTATQREDTDLLLPSFARLSHAPAPALSPARPPVHPSASGPSRFTVDTRHRYRGIAPRRGRRPGGGVRCIAAIRAIFECAIANGQCISARRGRRRRKSLSSPGAISRVGTRGKVDRISKTGSPYPCHRQCAKGDGKKARTPREAGTDARFHKHRRPFARARARRPLSPRRCEIERLI